jgi:hypothetical protein
LSGATFPPSPSLDLPTILLCLAVVAGHTALTLATLPEVPPGLPGLWITPAVSQILSDTLPQHWPSLLLPFQFEPARGGVYWQPTSILLLYFTQKYLGALASYLIFSNLFVVTAAIVARRLTGSLTFTATLAIAFGFGTQLDYAFAYGWLTIIYILLTYCAINCFTAVRLLSDDSARTSWRIGFVVSLCLVALAGEWWLNYATALICASAFGAIWTSHHQLPRLRASLLFILGASVAVLVTYLAVRLPFRGNFLKPGSEEELVFTYSHKILMLEDIIVNFFTFLYTALTNYLPSFVTSSNSLTYLDRATILAEQHGYDAPHQNLVLMNHLFLWRFYAGIALTGFFAFSGVALHRAWKTGSTSAAWIAALSIMVMTGFATHLIIKFRPYNSVPALPYKAIVSVSAYTVLLAYLTMLSGRFLKSRKAFHAIVAGVWGSIFLAALTRPGMEKHLLDGVGLIGLRDPLVRLFGVH